MKIGLDVDGVLANFYLHMCRAFDMPYDVVHEWNIPWIGDKFGQIADDPKFWESIPILNHPDSITFPVECYITAMPSSVVDARLKWLKDNGFPSRPLYVEYEKGPLAKQMQLDYFVDDKPQNVKEVSDNDVYGVRYVPYYYVLPDHNDYIRHLPQMNEISNFKLVM